MMNTLDTFNYCELLQQLPDPAFVLTRSGIYAAIFGGQDSRYYHDGSDLIDKHISDVLMPDKAAWFLQQIEIVLRKQTMQVVEYALSNQDVKGLNNSDGPAETIWFEGRISPLSFNISGEDAVLWVATNRTANHLLQEQLRALSMTDPLTELPNRRQLDPLLTEYADRVKRYAEVVTVLTWDIDHFKRVNDTFGHEKGDEVLLAMTRLCRQYLRRTDWLIRTGGDEFVVLMPYTEEQQARLFYQRFCAEVAKLMIALKIDGLDIGVSAGMTVIGRDDASNKAIVNRADQALYQAKRLGRNQLICH
ncbi:GGDEF domain-containing protein [Amphritea sp. 1_MG-2023]|uniref:sensor domain-containing diguanylate cyclase n=1 Tax=Amphritea sp. 1_MG-2023 TaxID=3062670 RepID=UPI0026E41D2D|nr:GGDEF domain-containing protein [Amphritea sp. 1_MG-2023]MDO6565312.1 GGDEF domain-containing protein [Amphritea sp. 1_MG-2023]